MVTSCYKHEKLRQAKSESNRLIGSNIMQSLRFSQIFVKAAFDKLCPKTLSILYNRRCLYKNEFDQPENLENLYFFPLSIFTKKQIDGNKVPELKIDVWNMKINWNAINWCCEIGIWQL